MTEAKPVLFTTALGFSYLVDDGGIRKKKKVDVTQEDLPPDDSTDPTSRAWSLIDSGPEQKPEFSSLQSGQLFAILTVSPAEERYKVWVKDKGALRWVMNPWSTEELLFL